LLLLVTGQLRAGCVGFLIGCSDHRQSLVRSRIRDHSHCVLGMVINRMNDCHPPIQVTAATTVIDTGGVSELKRNHIAVYDGKQIT